MYINSQQICNLRNILIFLLLILGSCNSKFEDKIRNKITKQCKSNNECTINLNDLTDFKWDRLCVFGATSTIGDVNKALGFNYPYYKEFSRLMVFTKENQIVYHEEIPSSIESLINKEVLFNYSDSVKFACYNPKNAIFRANIKTFEKGIYYELTQIK